MCSNLHKSGDGDPPNWRYRLAPIVHLSKGMSGFITERDLEEAETAFPGICRFYLRLQQKPSTFLDLMRLYLQEARGHDRKIAGCPYPASEIGYSS
jgi:hypothetical protein